ncbi:CorA family divalent cation transporter [Brevundimonas faecalis]|uniref:Magnesium transporter n=1 Tax=Brevundimonas faecalis TaxID=947378 RepID=A0ABV2R8Y3_9CAUL
MTLRIPTLAARPWLRLRRDDPAALARVAERHACRFPVEDVFDRDADFLYLPVDALRRDEPEADGRPLVFALGRDLLITLEPAEGLSPFDRLPAPAEKGAEAHAGPAAVFYDLLLALNADTEHVLALTGGGLESVNDRMRTIARGRDETGRDIDSSLIHEAMAELNVQEERVSRIQRSQLLLDRAARHLRQSLTERDQALRPHVETLISDIASVKERAGFEHAKLRYLQDSVTASLSAKQNEIVKVFTIITAVFLPPTLVATFYGMNFAVMPELAWKHGFSFTIVLTLLAALLPLIYIKKKGWLR